MRIGRWTLEILVDERPLREYIVPDSVLGISTSNALKSYVVEGIQKRFCDSATFVAVPTPGTYYSIKVSPSTKDIAARVYVDGINDDSYAKESESYTIIKGFRNRNRTTIYNFIFDKTEWIETNITQNTEFGGLGAISVYFYKIRTEYENSLNYDSISGPNKAFEEVKIPETKKKCFDVTLTTKFSEGIEYHRHRPSNIISIDRQPLAVLHINYRSADWFVVKGISIQENPSISASTTSTISANVTATSATSTSVTSISATSAHVATTSTSTSTYAATTSISAAAASVDIKNEVTNFENNIEDKTSITKIISRKRKRKYQEIIVILDSDEEIVELD